MTTLQQVEEGDEKAPRAEPREPGESIAEWMQRTKGCMRIVAPMVRYSRLPFRLLCRKWGADITFTPMLMADSFNESQHARDFFMTCNIDSPVIVQFAANSADELADAASKLAGRVDGIDVNCGCPQRWVRARGLGSALLGDPETVREMVRRTREASALPVSVKIRSLGDTRSTVAFARQVEAAGAAFVSLHGRTASERSSVPADLEGTRVLRESLSVPVVHNGDVWGEADVARVWRATRAHGVMAARGALRCPALYAGHDAAPDACVADYVALALAYGSTLANVSQQIAFMLADRLTVPETHELNRVTSVPALMDFLEKISPEIVLEIQKATRQLREKNQN